MLGGKVKLGKKKTVLGKGSLDGTMTSNKLAVEACG